MLFFISCYAHFLSPTFSLSFQHHLFLYQFNPPSLFLCFVRRNDHSALNAMGARGRITMAYSFQRCNTEQLAYRQHSPRRSSNFTAAASECSLEGGIFGKSEMQAAVIRALHLRDTTTHMIPLLEWRQGPVFAELMV